MKTNKTIRLSADVYNELLTYKAELEIENQRSLSFNDAIELLFTELAGLEYEATSTRLAARGYKYEPKQRKTA